MESARTTLLYGEWLRRDRRKNEARVRLRAALDGFERLGARAWADRARSELGATGPPVTKRQQIRSAADEAAGLTPQESQIVRLAAQGQSDKDIPACLRRVVVRQPSVARHIERMGAAPRGETGDRTGQEAIRKRSGIEKRGSPGRS